MPSDTQIREQQRAELCERNWQRVVASAHLTDVKRWTKGDQDRAYCQLKALEWPHNAFIDLAKGELWVDGRSYSTARVVGREVLNFEKPGASDVPWDDNCRDIWGQSEPDEC